MHIVVFSLLATNLVHLNNQLINQCAALSKAEVGILRKGKHAGQTVSSLLITAKLANHGCLGVHVYSRR